MYILGDCDVLQIGEKGETGSQGQKGEPGTPGLDGKYLLWWFIFKIENKKLCV